MPSHASPRDDEGVALLCLRYRFLIDRRVESIGWSVHHGSQYPSHVVLPALVLTLGAALPQKSESP
jgi:hypothetical protein